MLWCTTFMGGRLCADVSVPHTMGDIQLQQWIYNFKGDLAPKQMVLKWQSSVRSGESKFQHRFWGKVAKPKYYPKKIGQDIIHLT